MCCWYVTAGSFVWQHKQIVTVKQMPTHKSVHLLGYCLCLQGQRVLSIDAAVLTEGIFKLRHLRLGQFKKKVKNGIIEFLKRAFFFGRWGEWKRNEKKVGEKSCWATTHAKTRSCRRHSDFGVLKVGFQLSFLVWRSWLRHCATSRKVTGSIPDGIIGIFHWHNHSSRIMVLGSTQPLTDMSTRNISWGVKAAGA